MPSAYAVSPFLVINDTTHRQSSQIFTTGGFYIARQSAIADFNPQILDSTWFEGWTLFLSLDHCDLRCSFAPKQAFAALSSGIVTADVIGPVIHRGVWHPVIKVLKVRPIVPSCMFVDPLRV